MQAHYQEHRAIKLVMNATPETAHLAKVQFDALKWQMARLNPKVYGERPPEVQNSVSIHNHLHISEDQLKTIQAERSRFLGEGNNGTR